MKKFFNRILLFIFLINLFYVFGCSHHSPRLITHSFYYWKSVFALSSYEKNILHKLHVNTLYIKFFDVTWSNETKSATPAAQLQFKDTSYKFFTITPVVFITNETLMQTDSAGIGELSGKICKLLANIINQNSLITSHEIQFDCDWTENTKKKYFQLLKLARTHLDTLGFSSSKISTTIRLYQCRYISKTGVPPVDKGMLMCYNMGNLKNPATKNSILESDELKKYTSSLSNYPLPLDVAFPLFNWKVLFRNGVYQGLIKDLPGTMLTHKDFDVINNNRYTFLRDTSINNYSFKKGDTLREEQSSYKEIITSAKLVSSKLKTEQVNVILYHLDSLILSKYSSDELENIFDCMH